MSKMKKTTLKALKGSIKKWQNIVNEKGWDKGVVNCPLCSIFYNGGEADVDRLCVRRCEGCPVSEETGETCCDGSPYQEWVIHKDLHNHWAGSVDRDLESNASEICCSTCKRYAKAEIKFLKGLLP